MTAGFWAAVAILAAVGLWTHHSTRTLLDAFADVRQSHQLIETLGDLFADIKEAETSQGRYLLTRDENYVEPYHAALERVRDRVARLQEEYAEKPGQRHVRVLQPLFMNKLTQLRTGVELLRTQGFAAVVLDPQRAQLARSQIAEIRQIVEEMQAAETVLLGAREQELNLQSQLIIVIFLIGNFVSFVMLFIVFYFLNQQIAARQVAEQALQRAHDQLEVRVQERTAQLATANQSLVAEIAQREQAEAARQQAELHYRELVESVQAIVWRADAQTLRFSFVSRPAELILGYTVEQWLHEPEFWQNHIHPEDRDWVVLYSAEATRQKEQHDYEYRMLAADGRVVWLRNLARVIVENDQPKEVVGVMMDITEHHQAEDALHESEERFRQMAEGTDQVFWFTELNPERVLYVNPAFDKIWGIPRIALLDNPRLWLESLHPEDRARVRRAFQEWTAGRSPHYDVEYRIITGRGEMRWIRDRGAAIRDVAGRIYRVSGIADDVTERKTAERALRRSQQLLQSTIDALSAHIAILDERGVILSVNNAWRRFATESLHDDPHYLIGESYLAICGPAVGVGVREVVNRQRDEFRAEYWIAGVGGTRWFQVRVTRFDTDGPVRVVVAHEDVTEIKEVQEGLRTLSGRLLDLQDRERRHIASQLHDTTAQNLSAVTLNLARLREGLGADEKTQRTVSETVALAEQCLREIRTLSYLLHPPLLDEAGLMSALRWYVDGFTKRSHIPVAVIAQAERPRFAVELETALFRAAQEALTNIHRHSGCKQAAIEVAETATTVWMEIRDDGHGFQIEGWHGDNFEKLGVGLMGMHERLGQLGGALTVQSGPGGTTLRATLPLTRREHDSHSVG